MRIRKPRLYLSKKGKLSLSGGGVSFGGRHARVNFSRRGVSFSGGVRGVRYNSRRGWNCGLLVGMALLGGGGLLLGGAWLWA